MALCLRPPARGLHLCHRPLLSTTTTTTITTPPARAQKKRLSSASSSSASEHGLIYPAPPSPNHHDLPSFLAYADRSGLDRASTVYVGTHYEYGVARALARYGFALRRVGGHSDCGIDLLGTWAVPSAPRPLRVLVQCKALARRAGPHLVRELEGAFVGAPAGWRGGGGGGGGGGEGASGLLGLLVTERPATKGVRESLARSRWPMGFVACTREGHVQQMLWNHRAEEEGLEGMGAGTRHAAGGEDRTELLLTWKGGYLPLRDGS